jgi:hypothetical protein
MGMVKFAIRLLIVTPFLIAAIVLSDVRPPDEAARSVCDLLRHLPDYRDKPVSVRGISFFGLRQDCKGECAIGPLPSSLWLSGTGRESWLLLYQAERAAAQAAEEGIRVEVWVTVFGWLRTMAKDSPAGPCDTVGSHTYRYGHLGAFPAELQVERFSEVEIKANPVSPYDYAIFARGPSAW